MTGWAAFVPAVAAAAVSSIRWLRVAQREHYLSGSAARFAWRWWKVPVNLVLLAVVVAAATLGFGRTGAQATWLAVVGATAGPFGLVWRGRTSRLAWTRRLVRLAAATAVLVVVGSWILAVAAPSMVWLLPLGSPLMVDLAAALVKPLEARLGRSWVAKAEAGLRRAGSRTVAITGSYGKTSTKVALAHLLNGVAPTVASPASFNNTMGLARAVNEHLAPGTEVFVAEMGTYGPGEIRDMCRWVKPEVAVMTAIGPVHLERMGTLEAIAAAKREILETAAVGVLQVDDPHLSRIAAEESGRIRVVTVSNRDPGADVFVGSDGEVRLSGDSIGSVGDSVAHPGNLACALGAVLALGYDPRLVLDRVAEIPETPHRATISTSVSGITVVDDTFNSNPAGARAAVDLMGSGDGRRVLVTPGMVEMGGSQFEENRRLASDVSRQLTDLVVVGRTNRAALVRGATDGGLPSVIVVPDREAAVRWVRDNLRAGDTVLYENDLPDHYP